MMMIRQQKKILMIDDWIQSLTSASITKSKEEEEEAKMNESGSGCYDAGICGAAATVK